MEDGEAGHNPSPRGSAQVQRVRPKSRLCNPPSPDYSEEIPL